VLTGLLEYESSLGSGSGGGSGCCGCGCGVRGLCILFSFSDSFFIAPVISVRTASKSINVDIVSKAVVAKVIAANVATNVVPSIDVSAPSGPRWSHHHCLPVIIRRKVPSVHRKGYGCCSSRRSQSIRCHVSQGRLRAT
jgi:hypothetical protein